MASEIYDQNLDYAWVEAVADGPDSAEDPEEQRWQWHPPAFTCNRQIPSKGHAIIVGVGGAFDFFGTSRMWKGTALYRCRELSPNHANALAIYSDWCAVGRDLGRAVDDFERDELDRVQLDR